MWDWTEQPSPINTRWMNGEGYQVTFPTNLLNGCGFTKDHYEADAWARNWLKEQGHPVRESVTTTHRHNHSTMLIMSINWDKQAIAEFNSQQKARS